MSLCGLDDIRRADERLVAVPPGWRAGGTTVVQLERLSRLFDAGRLTDQEFQAAKSMLLTEV
jgi:hypothetical protein